jgi:uncharacterized protein (TIGR02452 family)
MYCHLFYVEEVTRVMATQNLIEVYQHTRSIFEPSSDRPRVYYVYSRKSYSSSDGGKPSIIEVTKEDTLSMAERYAREGYNPVILNFASNSAPGGHVEKGARAQEEDIFRRSSLFQTLNERFVSYPLNGKVVYSKNIRVVKDKDYNLIEPYTISCISAAAINHPQTITENSKEKFFFREDGEYIRNVISAILTIAVEHGHDSIILGAWGCGEFRGPRHHIAEIFKSVLNERNGALKKVGFGILSRKNPNTYKIFHDILVDEKSSL